MAESRPFSPEDEQAPSDEAAGGSEGGGAARSLRRIALIVAVATALSKLAGLVRQQVIAAAFGV
ncbi:MAG: hypothetical protein ACO3FN_10995, partial [Vulcanococcus sp.]